MPSMRWGMLGGALDQPYFFLSYARRDDRAAYVGRFYEDLLDALDLPGSVSDRQPTFRDVVNIMLGDDWLLELSRAVGSCRSMVALYSPAYFRSEYCGKEWTHFAARVKRYQDMTSVPPRALVPVLWEPVPQRRMPAEVRAVQYTEPGLGEEYLRHGLLQLMQSEPGGPAYTHVVEEIARRVRAAADPFNLPVDAPPAFDLSEVRGCFPVNERPELGGHVRIFVAACTKEQPPVGRSHTAYYGEAPWMWAPYSPPRVPTVVERAERVITGDGHTTSVEAVSPQLIRHLNRARHLNQACVLLVDAWSAREAPYRGALVRYDELYHPTTAVLVPCHEHDRESGTENEALWDAVRRVFERNWMRRNDPHDPVFWAPVDQHEFDDMLARAVTVTQNRIAASGHVRRLPPGGPPPSMPRL
ncbi:MULTISPECIES: TIR-like protein FxsC [Streptomyces]|uniref:TIR-like protein FxsC n=1 Tax=Streptomyces griseiscabiei TaxID=2993540 RepID=A0ABU4L3S3_9ACTN|nr:MULTISPECIES: TIR-like protein FxsC [Streptomyces]MBZ3905290.1 TIR domain-containing protein [Streptomyces griseiscabiei]MDX2910376.1 TIR-like protein FxsC [Streptomyces griseiscabiei]